MAADGRTIGAGRGAPLRPRFKAIHDGIPPDWAEIEHKLSQPRRPQPGFRTQMISVHVGAEQKAATYSALRLLVDQGLVLFPASAEELRRELLMLRVDLSPSGIERIEASSGHDDLADALALALVPYRARSGGWRTLLSDLADPSARLPDPPLSAGAGETVRTGEGVELPRRPTWVSPAGAEATAPDAPPPIHGDQEEHRPVGFHGHL